MELGHPENSVVESNVESPLRTQFSPMLTMEEGGSRGKEEKQIKSSELFSYYPFSILPSKTLG